MTTTMATTTTTNNNVCDKVTTGIFSLRGSPSELWKAYVLKAISAFSYFSFSFILTMFLSKEFHFTDLQAGSIYGLLGALITIYGFLGGCLIDRLGVATSLRLGFSIVLLARIQIFLTTSPTVMLVNTLLILPFGESLGIPVLTIGIRRYTNIMNREFAFGLFYVVQNISALLVGPVIDLCTIKIDSEDDNNKTAEADNDDTEIKRQLDSSEDEPIVWALTGHRAVILLCIIMNIISCIITLTIREIKAPETAAVAADDDDDDDDKDSSSLENNEHNDATKSQLSDDNKSVISSVSFKPQDFKPLETMKVYFKMKSFWRFLLVSILTVGVRMIFRHLDATWPKYMMREFGDNVPKGTIMSINPAIIIVLVPIITVLTRSVNALVIIHIGIYISSLSVFFLAYSTSIWASVCFITFLSIGEALWSPRMYVYSMSVIKEGQEGMMMAFCTAPLFLAKLPVGIISGYLLQKYCPAEGVRNCQEMWAIIGYITLSSPLLMTLFWKFISDPTEEGCAFCGGGGRDSSTEGSITEATSQDTSTRDDGRGVTMPSGEESREKPLPKIVMV